MLLSRKDIYDWLDVILKDGFYKDPKTQSISINKKLTEEELDSITCSFVNLLGNSEVPHPQNHTDKQELMSQFKVNSHFIDIDNKSIVMNKYGQLQMNVDDLVDNDEIVAALMNNKEFMAKIKDNLNPGKITMDWVMFYLLRNPYFINKLTALIMVMQKINEGEKDTTIEEEIENIVPNEDIPPEENPPEENENPLEENENTLKEDNIDEGN